MKHIGTFNPIDYRCLDYSAKVIIDIKKKQKWLVNKCDDEDIYWICRDNVMIRVCEDELIHIFGREIITEQLDAKIVPQ